MTAWMQTATGVVFHLDCPSARNVRAVDIAVHLTNIQRFSGAAESGSTSFAIQTTVAAHSCRVLDMVMSESVREALGFSSEKPSAALQLQALLHDAHEAYIGDISSPVKAALPERAKTGLRGLATRVDVAIGEAFGVDMRNVPLLVHACDMLALHWERTFYLGPETSPWVQSDRYNSILKELLPYVAGLNKRAPWLSLANYDPRPVDCHMKYVLVGDSHRHKFLAQFADSLRKLTTNVPSPATVDWVGIDPSCDTTLIKRCPNPEEE